MHFFKDYSQCFQLPLTKTNQALPFNNHAQFPLIVDMLNRKFNHHVICVGGISERLQLVFIESFLQHLDKTNGFLPTKKIKFIYFFGLDHAYAFDKEKLVQEFDAFCQHLKTAKQYFFLCFDNASFLNPTSSAEKLWLQKFAPLFDHPRCRVIVFNQQHPHESEVVTNKMAIISLLPPNESEQLNILKWFRITLETEHQLLIPEDLLWQAYALSQRYLCAEDPLSNAVLLLDSSAGRMRQQQKMPDPKQQMVLTRSILQEVLSTMIQIPHHLLSLTNFDYQGFVDEMSHKIFGQEMALSVISQSLRKGYALMQTKHGPYQTFLFVGPKHVGKKTTAITLVEQLFQQTHMFYKVSATEMHDSLLNIFIRNDEAHRAAPLKTIIVQKPYAVFLIEHCDRLPTRIVVELAEICSTGFLADKNGDIIDFRQAILILHMDGSFEGLTEPDEITQSDELDLMDFILKEQSVAHKVVPITPQNIIHEMMPTLEKILPVNFYQHAQIVPFVSLKETSLLNIMRLKLKNISRQLDARYHIELHYAAEVIPFLAHQAAMQPAGNWSHVFTQLHGCLEQALASQLQYKQRPNQLFLQLNETGQILRCHWQTERDVINQ